MSRDEGLEASEEDPLFRESIEFPDVSPISFTHREFPKTAKLMNEVGTPFGCLVTPFISLSDRSHMVSKLRKNADNSQQIARCSSCTGYMNPYCDVTPQRWFCSICGSRNNISRSQARYRGIDPRLLPEVQHLLVDYDAASPGHSKTKPFVHVLLVQESMPLDSLNAVVDGLSSAITSVHPDIYIVLITFSNRIGVYRLHRCKADTGNSKNSGLSISQPRQEIAAAGAKPSVGGRRVLGMHTPTPPPVQHIHFTFPKSQDAIDSVFDMDGVRQSLLGASRDQSEVHSGSCVATGRYQIRALDGLLGIGRPTADLSSPHSEEVADGVGVGRSIIEGRDPFVDFAATAGGNQISKPSNKLGDVSPLLSIGDAVNFWDACSRVGSCRNSFKSALSSLFDACPSVSSHSMFPGAAAAGGDGASSVEEEGSGGPAMAALVSLPAADHLKSTLNMLGPALDAVLSWLTEGPIIRQGADLDSNQDGLNEDPGSASESKAVNMLIGALESFGLFSSYNRKSNRVDGALEGEIDSDIDPRAPSSLACGISLHIIVASASDLPPGLHESSQCCAGRIGFSSRGVYFSPEWISETAERASRHNICVNIWGVASFESQLLRMSELSDLVAKTGGKAFRFILGTSPAGEGARLAEQLACCLSAQYASKCLFKLRASQLVDLRDAGGLMGHVSSDPVLPGVYKFACCSYDSTVASFLDYKPGAEGTNYAELEHIVVQAAFSYETLVESEDDIPQSEFELEEDVDRIDADVADGQNYYEGDDSLSCDHVKENGNHDKRNNGSEMMSMTTSDIAHTEYRQYVEKHCHLEADSQYLFQYEEEMAMLRSKSGKRKGVPEAPPRRITVRGKRSAYSHQKRLISVKRLRIITMALECVSKVPRLLGGTHAGALAVMVVREVLFRASPEGRHHCFPGVVQLIGGLYEWFLKLAACAAKAYFSIKIERKYPGLLRSKQYRHEKPGRDIWKSICEDAIESAVKDPVIQTSLHVIFGAMSRILRSQGPGQSAVTIGSSVREYLGDEAVVKEKIDRDSAVPTRQKARGSYYSDAPADVTYSSEKLSSHTRNYSFNDSFAEVLSLVLTQDACAAQKFLYPQLFPVRDDGPVTSAIRPKKESNGLSSSTDVKATCGVSSLVVEPKSIPPNRSGLSWSMMSHGSPLYILDAGDEIVLYRNTAISEKRPFAGLMNTGAENLASPVAEQLVTNPKWLLNDIKRRLDIAAYVPRVQYSISGSASSGHLSNHLMDLSGDENSITYLLDSVKEKIRSDLLQSLDSI